MTQVYYYRLGQKILRECEMPRGATYEEIAGAIGKSKQLAWIITCVAVGKLACGLRQRGFNEVLQLRKAP